MALLFSPTPDLRVRSPIRIMNIKFNKCEPNPKSPAGQTLRRNIWGNDLVGVGISGSVRFVLTSRLATVAILASPPWFSQVSVMGSPSHTLKLAISSLQKSFTR